uniref:Uncharacterized protein n=1 Tax=Setaria digitata TaxID=48799 RepID=A0A915PJI3_9BILA
MDGGVGGAVVVAQSGIRTHRTKFDVIRAFCDDCSVHATQREQSDLNGCTADQQCGNGAAGEQHGTKGTVRAACIQYKDGKMCSLIMTRATNYR